MISIGPGSFGGCTSLTSVTIPASVTSIGQLAFMECTNLVGVYFEEDAPNVHDDILGLGIFWNTANAVVYYLPGTVGWGETYSERPTEFWLPEILTGDPAFGVQAGQFGFAITWARDQVVLVEASTDLGNPNWSPVSTNTLTDGSSYFSDPDWTNYAARLYRLRSP